MRYLLPVRGPALAGVLAVAVSSAASAADTPPAPKALTLTEVMKVAYERSPDIQKAREEMHYFEGAFRAASGTFDHVLTVNPSVTHSEGYLSSGSASNEDRRRRGYAALRDAFGTMHDEIEQIIARDSTDLPVCPDGITIYSDTVLADGIPTPICRPAGTEATDASTGRYDPQLLSSTALLFNPTAGDADLAQFEQRIAELLGLAIQDFAESLKQEGLERIQQAERLSAEWEKRAALSLERLGPMPKFEWVRTAALDMRLRKMRRDGRIFELQAHLEGVENNYRGKPLDPIFGGKGVQNAFRSSLALVFTQPLQRGRGKASAGAAEGAARENFLAAAARYQHTVARQSLEIARAYFDLVAAQATEALLEDSVRSQKQLLDGTRLLKKAGEIARADVTRAEARLADVQAQAASARINRLAMETTLAEIVGIDPADALPGLTARESFAPAPPEPDPNALAAGALAARSDLRAAELSHGAAQILREAARIDLKPRLDLSLRLGLTSDYFSPYFRVLRDELTPTRNPLEPLETPLDYFSPKGVFRTFSNRPQPELAIKLTFQLPIGNRRQRGRLLQASASSDQARVRAADLRRVIEHNVNEIVGIVERTRAELTQRRTAAAEHQNTWKATQERHVAGDMTLIDVLKTEQDYTGARLQLVEAERQFARDLTRLRFETGTLVSFAEGVAGTPDISGLLKP